MDNVASVDGLSSFEHENLSSVVYSAMCSAIREGKFKPGERLKIRDIAERMGTSVTPVRDAILRLAHDEAIEFKSARDIRIPKLTSSRYREIRAIRLRLEALAAETAARLSEPHDVMILERLLRENELAIQEGDALRGSELNQRFHFQIVEIARLPLLRGILQRIWLQMGPVISDSYLSGERSMIDYHYAVVKAIRDKDPNAAAAAIMSDILHGGKAIADKIEAESTG